MDLTQESLRQEVYEAFQFMKAKKFSEAEALLKKSLEQVQKEKLAAQEGIFYSTLAVLEKLKGDFKASWRYYEKAEKLIPDDPSLKIIMAKLLIEHFAQYDSAIKKMKKVLEIVKGSAAFEHQAYATLSVAYLRKGDKKKSLEMFDQAMKDDFKEMTTAENINLDVVQAFLSRNYEVERCRNYIDKALKLATDKNEKKMIDFLTRLGESIVAS